ncbi:uncharacterized protein A4U43_C08F6950 [Asparagus officinalis]|nr:uncharacterized protein A4U43_C08F6950 [Asparagus officinalis]
MISYKESSIQAWVMDDEVPSVNEDVEVKRLKRLEAIRSRKPYDVCLKKYLSRSDDQTKRKKKKKKDKNLRPNPAAAGFLVVDEDPVWQKPVIYEEEESADDEVPLVDEDVEVTRLKRLEAIRSRKPYGGISEDGSGWVSISNSDLSPPRQRRSRLDTPPSDREPNADDAKDADLSPPRRRKGVVDDLSPPRRNRNRSPKVDADLSPPRRNRKEPVNDLSPPRRNRNQSPEVGDDLSSPRRSRQRFAAMDPSMSGKGAQPVFRDKEGRRINTEQLARAQEEEKPKEKNLEWGKGLAQKREAEARIKDLELEKDKPFARTRDDPELDKMLKERIRWGDPMAHLVKKNSELVLEDLGTDEKMKESGFIVPQSIPSHSWIKRGIDFPPNRYGIRPGRHWDGVDCSNGYEKELFKRQNEKRATETEAYLWSVSDMCEPSGKNFVRCMFLQYDGKELCFGQKAFGLKLAYL